MEDIGEDGKDVLFRMKGSYTYVAMKCQDFGMQSMIAFEPDNNGGLKANTPSVMQ